MNRLLCGRSTRGPLCVLTSGTLLLGFLLAVPASAEAQYGERKASRATFKWVDDIAEQKNPAMYAVGHPARGYANGFCIHRSARLLVTAAHVADYKYEYGSLYAGSYGDGPGAGKMHKVKKVWYLQPLVLRMKGGPYYAWGEGPDFGKVDGGADVAILQLEGHERGRPLPAAFTLFEEKEGEDPGYVGRQVGQLRFKGTWTVRGDRIAALLHDGVISYTEGDNPGPFNEETPRSAVLFKSRPNTILYHTMSGEPGSSGSPVFLPDGRVIGVNASSWWNEDEDRKSGGAVNVFWAWAIICNDPELRRYFDLPENEREIREYLGLFKEIEDVRNSPVPPTNQAGGKQAEATSLRQGYGGQAGRQAKQPPAKRGHTKESSRSRSY